MNKIYHPTTLSQRSTRAERLPYACPQASLLRLQRRLSILSSSSVPGDREEVEEGSVINDDPFGLEFD